MHLHQILPPLYSLSFSFPLLTSAVSSNLLCFLSLSIFYPSPYTRLALAAPCFLNLSSSILFGSLLRSSNTRSEVLLFSLLSILHESSSQLELVLLFSHFFPHPLSGSLYPGPCRSPSPSFFPSVPFTPSRSCPQPSSTALSFAPPFPVTIRRSRAAGGTEKRRP